MIEFWCLVFGVALGIKMNFIERERERERKGDTIDVTWH